jgi:hypothetical protein
MSEATTTVFHCGAASASVRFDTDGSIAELGLGGGGSSSGLGRFQYQTLSEENFTTFDRLYTGKPCATNNMTRLETPACHNFAKPNMSSAYGGNFAGGYGVWSPTMVKLYRSKDSCSFVSEAVFQDHDLVELKGAPRLIVSSFSLGRKTGTAIELAVNVSAVNKTRTRLAEALWVSFKPSSASMNSTSSGGVGGDAEDNAQGWMLRYWGGVPKPVGSAAPVVPSEIAPTDVVEHGAIHLHALGSDGSLVYYNSSQHKLASMELVSLDVPIVSAGLLSPFPTALDTAAGADNSTASILGAIARQGWHYNLANNIWNTNFPQWYPFDERDTEMLSRFVLHYGRQA